MEQSKVFIDTDVIISSLLSDKGASYELMMNKNLEKMISKMVERESKEVSGRHKIDYKSGKKRFKSLEVKPLNATKEKILGKYGDYVSDEEDAHVVGGTDITGSSFILTHNIKHFKVEKIKRDLRILVMSPGEYLQYLRSVG